VWDFLRSQSRRGIVRSELSVKEWAAELPSVGRVRPKRCPGCKRASQPLGGKIVLHGHGRRERQLRGPAAPDERPALSGLLLRRYRCKICKALCTVGPRELLTQRLYSASAIAWALALFGVLRLGAAQVRELVSPWAIWGVSGHRWPTLLRWVEAIRARRLLQCVRAAPLAWTARRLAERAATTLAALALPTLEPPSIAVQAFHGAARAY
jgi:hypothetical protein